MNFKEKVQSMTAKEIIMTMVESLQNPSIKIDMNTFGEVKNIKSWFGFINKKTCFGCAATNTICRIGNITFTDENIAVDSKRAVALGTDPDFLRVFETAIDMLRVGNIYEYNHLAGVKGFARIDDSFRLPKLYNNYTQDELNCYIKLADSQK